MCSTICCCSHEWNIAPLSAAWQVTLAGTYEDLSKSYGTTLAEKDVSSSK